MQQIVPVGRLNLAQDFSPGSGDSLTPSPGGMAEPSPDFSPGLAVVNATSSHPALFLEEQLTLTNSHIIAFFDAALA